MAFDDSTLDTARTLEQYGQTRFVGLSIQCHPDLRRIGHVARLFDPEQVGDVALSRAEPLFRDSQDLHPQALDTTRASRIPVRISVRADATLHVAVAEGSDVRIDDRVVTDNWHCPLQQLEQGISLQLGKYLSFELGWFQSPTSDQRPDHTEHQLLGQSTRMRQLREEIGRVSDLDVAVLLRGETGVGKELVASALHQGSPRRGGNYVCVNMAAISATLPASELFGHVKGAFTGASNEREGYFAAADRGTLFLDEIGETAAEVQTALLRVMETGVIQPLGGQPQTVSVRLVAATDSDLDAAVSSGKFSHALLRRFGYEIRVPALREHRQDIPELFARFLTQELEALGELHRFEATEQDRQPFLTAALVQRLIQHDWPGNVRELRAAARRYAIYNRGRKHVQLDDLLRAIMEVAEVVEGSSSEGPTTLATPAPAVKRQRVTWTDNEIADALARCDYEIDRTARVLEVSRSWLHVRIENMTSVRKAKDLTAEEIDAASGEQTFDLSATARMLKVSAKGLQLQMTRLGIKGKRDGNAP